jgi:hypothetical protein
MSKRKSYKVPEAQLNLFDLDHPVMPVLDVSRCEARLINHETAARIVETYHYAHRVPSITFAVGLFIDGILCGTCTYSTMFTNISSSVCGPDYQSNLLELSRLFIFDWAGRNIESWLIAQSFRLLEIHRPDIKILMSYADSGQNHTGYIYQATNWLYTGMSDGTTEFKLNGEVVSARNRAFRKNTRTNGGGDGGVKELDELKDIYGEIEKIKTTPKYRYVYFLGNKRQRKELRKALKWPVLPYPK